MHYQAAADARASQDIVYIFEHFEMFFRRLEIYTKDPPTEMIDIITQLLAEVLFILGIATKENRPSRLSEYCSASVSPLTERCPEKYMNKLIGRADIKDALKRLDDLTQEGARVEFAQNLNAMHTVDERVTAANTAAIASTMPGVDRVTSVDGVKCMLSPNLISPKSGAL